MTIAFHKTSINFNESFKKKIFGQKTICQWSNSGPGAEKRRAEWPNGHLPENRSYPELPQDMGDLRSHWVGSVWPQKMGVIWVKMEIFEPEATGRNSVARKRKKLPQIGWCQNDRNFGGFAAVHSDFYVEGPKRAFLALFWAPGGLGSIFFRI